MGALRKILIVEDEKELLKAYRSELESDALTVLTATTIEEAIKAFEENPDVAVVILDGFFPHHEGGDHRPEPGRPCSGEKFVIWLRGRRRGYAGPIIACSSDSAVSARMVAAGATSACEKGRPVCTAIRLLLGLGA